MLRTLGVILPLAIPGCRTWGLKDDHAWSIQMPRKVFNRGESLFFRVVTRDRSGNPVEGISFLWSVDWVGIAGMRHKGRSFQELDIRRKGGPGEAYLRVYAYDPDGNVVQVLKEPFQMN